MADYAYDNSTGSLFKEPSYMTAIDPVIKQPATTETKDAVKSIPPTSNWSVCRVFLIVVASLVIGCVVGGAVIYILAPQTCTPANTSEDSGSFQGCAENTDVTATSGQFMCPTCPVAPTYCTCPTCPVAPTDFTCPTCAVAPTSTDTIDTSTDTVDTSLPKDCQEVKARGNVASGQYMISPQNGEGSFPVYCDMDTDGGGWTVFQRREDGSVDFFLTWIDYVNGFGNVNLEHWLGNTNIHDITAQGNYELRVDMADFDGNVAYAKYDSFRIGNAGTQYKLILGSYSGDAGDSLRRQENQAFSTKDRDNDAFGGGSCAIQTKGAWWYADCHDSNLNGLYYLGGPHDFEGDGVNWRTWRGYHYSLKHVEMKIRMAP